jgi:hypothetical protein
MSLYPGYGDGTLGYPYFPGYFYNLQSTVAGDFNRDGIPDIAFTSNPNFYLPNSTQVTILVGQGDGNFVTGISVPVPTGQFGQLIAADFNGNGILDLVVVDNTDAVFSVLNGNGDGTFQAPRIFGTATNPNCIISGRFRAGSKRGELDLALCTGPGIALELNTTQ